MLELLAPAGNMECAEAAIYNGANAIYVGLGNFSARQSAENFDSAAFSALIKKAHSFGVKVYVAMNTIVKNEELSSFVQTLLFAWNHGADAIILQDIFLGKYIHEQYPNILLHLSTQAGVCNLEGAKIAKEYGFSRVILARETPLSEIKKIAQFIETEVFVQGALCIAFSGNSYDWIPQFKTGKTLNELSGKTLIFEIKFKNGSLYSLEGDCIPVMNLEGTRYREYNTLPTNKNYF